MSHDSCPWSWGKWCREERDKKRKRNGERNKVKDVEFGFPVV